MFLTTLQKTKIVECYFETKSIAKTCRLYLSHFNTTKAPTKRSICLLIKKFKEKGTVNNQNKRNSGRRKTIRAEANIDAVHQ
jgi:GH35 family endo-1,4-beta-xylanase